MKLIYFEMRKSWLKLPLMLLLILFILIDIYKINNDFIINDAAAGSEMLIRNSKPELYQSMRGKITQEKIDFIKTNSDTLAKEVESFAFSTEYDESRYTGYVFGDYRLFDGTFKNDFRDIAMYANLSNRIAQQAYENIEFYEAHNNRYEQQKNIMIMNAYQNRSLDSYYLTQGSEIFFDYDFSCLLALFMIVAVFCQSFSREKEQGMHRLIAISAGAESTIIAKCVAASSFSAILSIVFTSVDWITMNSLYNLDGLTQPIYSLNSFEYSPFNTSVIGMMFNMLVIRFVVYFLISLVIMIISSLSKSSLLSLVLSFAFVAGLVLLQENITSFLNPVEMLSPQKHLAEFQCVNIAGYPIYTIFASLLTAILMSGSAIWLLYFINRRRSYATI